MMNISKYFQTELTEIIIQVPSNISTTKFLNKVKAYCLRLRRKTNIETLYACTKCGVGVVLICVHLEDTIEKKQRGRKKNAIKGKFLDDITDKDCEALSHAYGC